MKGGVNKQLKDARMEYVVLTAASLFLSHGLENVSMNDIAKECEIGVASLYRYFGTKTEIAIRAGTYLWNDFQKLYAEWMTENKGETGVEYMERLLEIFPNLYEEHKDFLRFLHDFDVMMLREKVPKEQLADYEKEILDLLPFMKRAYEKGVKDKTLQEGVQVEVLYFTVTRALLLMGEKFVLGDILPGDALVPKEAQLRQLMSMALGQVKR